MSLPSKTGLTGLRETDMLILQQLRDDELNPVCEVNAYLKSICDDPIFWYYRINNKLKPSWDKYLNTAREYFLKTSYTGQHEYIKIVKDFYGFKTLKELSAFMDIVPQDALFLIFNYGNTIDAILKSFYTFNRDELPSYINYDELIEYLRRELAKTVYIKNNARGIYPPILPFTNELPGYSVDRTRTAYKPDVFIDLQKLGIKL